MSETIVLRLEDEQINYLERLNVELESKAFIIDRIFSNHAKDTDASVIESEGFKKYMKEFELIHAEYELAKYNLEEMILKPEVQRYTNSQNVDFNWTIKNFASHECEVTLL